MRFVISTVIFIAVCATVPVLGLIGIGLALVVIWSVQDG